MPLQNASRVYGLCTLHPGPIYCHDASRIERGLATVVAAFLLLAPLPVRAAPDAENLVVKAEKALGKLEYSRAAELFERAYQTLSARERTTPLGEHLVLNAAEAHEQAWLASDEISELESASRLLRKHIALAEVREASVGSEVTQTRDRVDGLLENLSRGEKPDDVDEDPEPADETTTSPSGSETQNVAEEPPPPSKPDGLTIGLLAGGSAAVVGGAVALGVGATFPALAERRLVERGGSGENDEAFRDDAKRTSLALMISGGALAAMGTTAIIIGSIRAVRASRSSTAGSTSAKSTRTNRHLHVRKWLRVSPTLVCGHGGLVLSGRW